MILNIGTLHWYTQQCWYYNPNELIYDDLLNSSHLSHFSVGNLNVYMGCLAHSLHSLSSIPDEIVKTIFLFIFSLHWEGGKSMFQKRRRYEWRKKPRQLSSRQSNNALPPQRILLQPVTWPTVGTYGTLGCFVTPITPPGISWQFPIRQMHAIGSKLDEVMCTNW